MADNITKAAIKERIIALEQRVAKNIVNPMGLPPFDVKDVATHRPFDKPFPGVENPPIMVKPAFLTRQIIIPVVAFPLWSIAVCMATGSLYPLIFMLLPLIVVLLFYANRSRLDRAAIVLDKDGIGMSGQHYPWKDIVAAFIVERAQSPRDGHFLVLGLMDGQLVYHPVYNTDMRATFTGQLCASIRYFMKDQLRTT